MSLRAPRLVALAVVLVAAACGSDDDGDATAAPESTTPAEEMTTTTTTTTTTDGPAGVVIEVEVAGGQPVGGVQAVEVALGDEVTIHVSGDVEDEVHVHGYDLTADLAPGTVAEITFTADIPGQFEVELEAAHEPIIDLIVS